MKTFQQPLTAGEEAYYIRLLREGTVEEAIQAKEILVERNLRLVAHIAKKYQNVEEDMEDLISIGCIGLIKAVNSFDSGKGRLATYACRCIDNELLMMLRSRKKLSREVSLYEPIGQDKEGNAIHLLDVIEEKQKDIVEDMELGRNIRRLFSALDHCPVRQRIPDSCNALRPAGAERAYAAGGRGYSWNLQKLCVPYGKTSAA